MKAKTGLPSRVRITTSSEATSTSRSSEGLSLSIASSLIISPLECCCRIPVRFYRKECQGSWRPFAILAKKAPTLALRQSRGRPSVSQRGCWSVVQKQRMPVWQTHTWHTRKGSKVSTFPHGDTEFYVVSQCPLCFVP